MSKKNIIRLLLLVSTPFYVLMMNYYFGEATTNKTNGKPTVNEGSFYEVSKVVDGDTIDVKVDEQIVRIRLLNVDTPETKYNNTKVVNEYGKVASDFTKKTLERKKVRFIFDKDRFDKYGRVLALVFIDDSDDVENSLNATLVKNGFARVDKYGRNKTYFKDLKKMQDKAFNEKIGIWESKKVFKETFESKKYPY